MADGGTLAVMPAVASTARAQAGGREDVACPGCGSERRTPLLVGRDPISLDAFPVVRCDECQLAYVTPRPDAKHLPAYYPTRYFGKRHPMFKRQLMALRTHELGRPAPGARLLDIGCGYGDFILACKEKGWQVTGAEQAASPIFEFHEELGVDVVPVEDLAKLPAASFDVITLWHVFEHLPDPVALLREARRLLKVGGRLLIEVPNFGGWHGRLGGAAWHHHDVPRHLLHFSRKTLTSMLARERLVPERWSTFSIEYDTFGTAQTYLNWICHRPNHLYQWLIRQPTGGTRRDTILTLLLILPATIVAGIFSIVAALVGQGGVLRVISRKQTA
jgi:2-polyprenyl-3-methyl-5-hydroxy-6-metoxy-1,4-benzoquinol methylase